MRKLIFLFILMLAVGVATKAADVTFKASAPQAVVMGEQFRLTFTVNAEGKDLRVQEMPDFDVLMGPSQSTSYSSSWVNGKSTSETTVTYTYVLMPKKEGTFNIAPATIKVNGSNYTSNGLAIKVLPADKAGKQEAETTTASGAISNDRLFVKMDVSKRSVFEQEGFLVTFKVYSLENFSITGLKYPEFEGFLVQEVELPQEKQLTLENYNGRNYQSAVMRQVILYPQRSGKITIEGGKYDAVVRVRMQQAGGGSIFDSFFDSYRDVSKVLTTSPVTIDVKPLPSGKPASFSGAVGTFSMTADIRWTSRPRPPVSVEARRSNIWRYPVMRVISRSRRSLFPISISSPVRTRPSSPSLISCMWSKVRAVAVLPRSYRTSVIKRA